MKISTYVILDLTCNGTIPADLTRAKRGGPRLLAQHEPSPAQNSTKRARTDLKHTPCLGLAAGC
jgi:hypothetical protein